MPYIYKITNDINGKIYIGKTLNTIRERWEEHCNDYQRRRCEKRPLYSAMNKYGIEHFHIELVEECSDKEINERERYWIEYYGSFKYGYNTTLGGDGKNYIDYDFVVALYKENQNMSEVAKKLNILPETVSKILKSRNILTLTSQEVTARKTSKPIQAFDINDNYLFSFGSVNDASRFLLKKGLAKGPINGVTARLGQVANGKRKTAYKMKWKWL